MSWTFDVHLHIGSMGLGYMPTFVIQKSTMGFISIFHHHLLWENIFLKLFPGILLRKSKWLWSEPFLESHFMNVWVNPCFFRGGKFRVAHKLVPFESQHFACRASCWRVRCWRSLVLWLALAEPSLQRSCTLVTLGGCRWVGNGQRIVCFYSHVSGSSYLY